ncbi:VP2 [Bluetongue virus]|uniref:Outer capsid protein VP2 n=1 Tax=Bluetongue virus TaxID=40051 RepID=A0A2H4KNP0_BTV|nr:VP2 [Bluetongue virus]
MEEFVIPIFSERNMPYSLISYYPLAIQTDKLIPDDDEVHDVTKIPESNMIDISSLGVIEALEYKPSRNDGIVVPRLLDITLRAYDSRKALKETYGEEFVTDAEWMRWAINDRMDIQPLKIEIDQSQAINHQLFNCNVKVRHGNVDTVYYDYHPLECRKTKCNHSNIELMRSLTMIEAFHILQGAAYALKANFELEVIEERESSMRPYTMDDSLVVRNHGARRVNSGEELYRKFIKNLVRVNVHGRCQDEIQQEVTQLRGIMERWKSASYDGQEIRAMELCRILSTIGRKATDTYGEPINEEGITQRFQYEIDEKFSRAYRENKNVLNTSRPANDIKKFYALIMIAATDTQMGRIWRTNPYPCLRGALIAAECALGDVYYALRRIFNWSVRQTYGGDERSLERNQYLYGRVNLFDERLPRGRDIFFWQYELVQPAETSNDNGYICTAVEKEGELLCKIDETEYKKMFDEMNVRGWLQEQFKLFKLLTTPNLLTIDFEKDIYLNENSELVVPRYLDKWINAPIFNARLRITTGQIDKEKTDDPWNCRIEDGTMRASTESLGYVLGRFYDLRLQFVEDVLNKRQQSSSIYAHFAKQEDFPTLTHYVKGEEVCPHAGGTFYTFRRIALEVISCYERLDPELHEGEEHRSYVHPVVNYSHRQRVMDMEDVSQLICYIIDYIFERRDQLRKVNEARRIVYLIQNMTGKNRLMTLGQAFPNFLKKFEKLRDVRRIGDLNVINFMPLLLLVRAGAKYRHRQWAVPMVLYDDIIRLIPVEVGAHANRFGFKSFFNYILFHPGDAQKRQDANESQKRAGSVCYDYYINTTISQCDVDVAVHMTKLDTLKVHLSALCAGISDAIVYTLPVTHPEKCIVLIIIGDDKLDPYVRSEIVTGRYYYSRRHIRGVVSICLNQRGEFKVYTSGIVKHRICKKSILKYKCDVILVRTPGYVFGNDELMTKLLNV